MQGSIETMLSNQITQVKASCESRHVSNFGTHKGLETFLRIGALDLGHFAVYAIYAGRHVLG